MQMTKELEKRLKIMERFNQRSKQMEERFYYGKIFVHNDIMTSCMQQTDIFLLFLLI